jgi:hypothetical protein
MNLEDNNTDDSNPSCLQGLSDVYSGDGIMFTGSLSLGPTLSCCGQLHRLLEALRQILSITQEADFEVILDRTSSWTSKKTTSLQNFTDEDKTLSNIKSQGLIPITRQVPLGTCIWEARQFRWQGAGNPPHHENVQVMLEE